MTRKPAGLVFGGWFSVRCVFANRRSGRRAITYEERITVWQAGSADVAIRLAEREARAYARSMSSPGDICRYLGFAESYETSLRRLGHGDEVFSLMRDSRLEGERYLDRHFDTGQEHRTRTRPGQNRRQRKLSRTTR